MNAICCILRQSLHFFRNTDSIYCKTGLKQLFAHTQQRVKIKSNSWFHKSWNIIDYHIFHELEETWLRIAYDIDVSSSVFSIKHSNTVYEHANYDNTTAVNMNWLWEQSLSPPSARAMARKEYSVNGRRSKSYHHILLDNITVKTSFEKVLNSQGYT